MTKVDFGSRTSNFCFKSMYAATGPLVPRELVFDRGTELERDAAGVGYLDEKHDCSSSGIGFAKSSRGSSRSENHGGILESSLALK